MSTTFILATSDSQLAAAWEAQIPTGRPVVRLFASSNAAVQPGLSAVVILDSNVESDLPAPLAKCPTIFVGEPRSLPYEQARISGRAKLYLSYEESTHRIREYLPLLEELAAKESMVGLLVDKSRRADTGGSRSPLRVGVPAEPSELWDFLEGAVESIDSRDRLLAEFRRASRVLLRASQAVFLLRETDGFRADRGTSFFPADDPIVSYFEAHPVLIDSSLWEGGMDPVAELAVRNRIAMWSARLLIPIHENGRLLGLIALGIRDDGLPYDETDRNRAVCFARLLRQCMAKCGQLGRLQSLAAQSTLGAKYLPSTVILDPEEAVPRHVPLPIRDLIGRVRRSRELSRLTPAEGQPFRASAGLVSETGGVWCFWQEASGDVSDASSKRRIERIGLLRELALTLSHELGNPLVSLATFRQTPDGTVPPPGMVAAIKGDITRLEELSNRLAQMQGLDEIAPSATDIRDIAKVVGDSRGIRVDVGPEPVILRVAARQLELAMGALVDSLAENRPGLGNSNLSIELRSTGVGSDLTALFSIRGSQLELEGILPEPVVGGVPNQGRMGVFLAKEVIKIHHGNIHAGPGMEGIEILISIRSC